MKFDKVMLSYIIIYIFVMMNVFEKFSFQVSIYLILTCCINHCLHLADSLKYWYKISFIENLTDLHTI